jgi:hypothetical protein
LPASFVVARFRRNQTSTDHEDIAPPRMVSCAYKLERFRLFPKKLLEDSHCHLFEYCNFPRQGLVDIRKVGFHMSIAQVGS